MNQEVAFPVNSDVIKKRCAAQSQNRTINCAMYVHNSKHNISDQRFCDYLEFVRYAMNQTLSQYITYTFPHTYTLQKPHNVHMDIMWIHMLSTHYYHEWGGGG